MSLQIFLKTYREHSSAVLRNNLIFNLTQLCFEQLMSQKQKVTQFQSALFFPTVEKTMWSRFLNFSSSVNHR